MQQTNIDKIDSLKQKLGTSTIIREDLLTPQNNMNFSMINKQSYAPVDRYDLNIKETQRIEELKRRIKDETIQGVKYEEQKRELEYLTQDQMDIQAKIKSDFTHSIEAIRTTMTDLQYKIEEIEKKVEDKNELLIRKQDENNAMESEVSELLDENKVIESELKRLGEKTTSKLKEMQNKMQNNLNDLENLQKKNNADREKLKQFSMDKIKRIEDEFKIKLQTNNDRLNEMTSTRQNLESELLRLQDTKKRAEGELESKLKAIKEQYYEEAFNDSRGILKVLNNRFKTAIEAKEISIRKNEQLQMELEQIDENIKNDEKHLNIDNAQVMEAISEVREDTMTAQKDIDDMRSLSISMDSQHAKLTSDIQKAKYGFKQINDNGKFKLKENMDKYRNALEDSKQKVSNQVNKIKMLEEELDGLKQKYTQNESNNNKMLQGMKSQLNKNFISTFNNYKEPQAPPRESYFSKSNYQYWNY